MGLSQEMDGVVESLMEEIQGAEQATKASPATAGPDSKTEPVYASAPEVTRSTLCTLSVPSDPLGPSLKNTCSSYD